MEQMPEHHAAVAGDSVAPEDSERPLGGPAQSPMKLSVEEVSTLLGVSVSRVARLRGLRLLADDTANIELSDVADFVQRRDAATRDVAAAVDRVRRRPTIELSVSEQALLAQM